MSGVDLCLECSTFTLFCSKGLKKICYTCQEAVGYRGSLRKEECVK